MLGVSILIISLISGALQFLDQTHITLFFWTWQLNELSGGFLYALGIVGLTLLLTSFYMIMPVGKISFRHALVGSFAVVILWEMVRHIMAWYFSTLSMINLIYGSLATAIVALVFLEMAALILLFGAQIIAEYERIDHGDTEDQGFST